MVTKIREYAEEMEVEIKVIVKECGGRGEGRLGIYAKNEGGCNGTDVDLLDVIE